MVQTEAVTVEREGHIAWVTIDNPPVNATSRAVRAGLVRAIDSVAGARAAVLRCAGRTFVAGGDMSEFDAAPVEPHLPDVVQLIETSGVPFIALLHGNVLGGGFELAMACAWRIAAPGTGFGLPEVNVGLIPGAGGTQRLPRLVGMAPAIDIACRGRIVTAAKMLGLGGIDDVAADPQAAARALVADLPERPAPVSARPVPSFAPDLIDNARADLTRKSRGQQSPLENLAALEWALEPFAAGQPRERKRHLELRQSRESRALRHVFFAERAASRPAAIAGAEARETGRIAVVGGGLMGAGIAAAALMAGLEVRLVERDAEAVAGAEDRVTDLLAGAMTRGKMDAGGRQDALARFKAADSYGVAAGADLAIEAVFEDAAVKRDVFARLAAEMDGAALLATNTSYLDPREIFAGIANPARCLGLHFFSPAHVMKLVEVIGTPDSSPGTLATGFALARRLRKQPVLSGICDGFIGNRILSAYRRAADYLLADGALPYQVDAAMRAFGMPMGPYETQDFAGLQIAWANRKRQAATRPAGERYIPVADWLCERQRFGRRSGKGWYDYGADGRTPQRSAEVEVLVAAYSRDRGIARHDYSETEISERLLAVMANEGTRIVEEGIAERPGDVDVVEIHGYGFPRWRGGPMHHAGETGREVTRRTMQRVAEESPGSWVVAQAL